MTYTSPNTTRPDSNGFMYAAWGGEQVIDANTRPGTGAMALTEAIRYNATLRSAYISTALTNGVDLNQTNIDTINA